MRKQGSTADAHTKTANRFCLEFSNLFGGLGACGLILRLEEPWPFLEVEGWFGWTGRRPSEDHLILTSLQREMTSLMTSSKIKNV